MEENMDTNKMESSVRRLYSEVYSKGNIKICDELCSSSLKFHDAAVKGTKNGLQALKEAEATYFKAFPNKKATIEDLIVQDNQVVVRWSCQGKQDGEFEGIAATHRTFTLTGISIYTFTNDKITEVWQAWDRLSLLEQLGATQLAHAHR